MLEDVRIKGVPGGVSIRPAADCRKIRLTGPYTFDEQRETVDFLPQKCVLLKIRKTGICPADLRYVSFSRPPEIMRERIPMCIFHEGIAEVLAAADGAGSLSKGQRVAVVPNVPCYVHDPVSYPGKERACMSCRPGGRGENVCEDVKFLASNAQGLSRTHVIHPGQCTVPVPEEIPDDVAPLVEVLTVVLRGVRDSRVKEGDTVLVTGAGAIGYLTALLVSHTANVPKEKLFITDIFDEKLRGTESFATPVNTRTSGALKPLVNKVDKTFECAGGNAMEVTMDQASECAAPGGVIVVLGVHEHKVGVRIRAMHVKGLTLIGTHRSETSDFVEMLELMKSPSLQREARKIINPKRFPPTADGLAAACRTAADPNEHGKVIVDWEQD